VGCIGERNIKFITEVRKGRKNSIRRYRPARVEHEMDEPGDKTALYLACRPACCLLNILLCSSSLKMMIMTV
jgi:hypothetical protein